MPLKPDKAQTSEEEIDFAVSLFFYVIVALVFSASAVLFYKFKKVGFNLLGFDPHVLPLFPQWTEIMQNLNLMFHGYMSGYGRTLIGFGIFGIMAVFFFSTGILCLNLLFHASGSQDDSSFCTFNLSEKVSLSYVTGSLIASLLWFALGTAGILNIYAAITLGAFGMILFLKVLFSAKSEGSGPLLSFGKKVLFWLRQYTLTEKILLSLLIVTVLFFSSGSFQPPFQGDSLVHYMATPQYYINEGGMHINPWNYCTYYTQNTEMLVTWALLFGSEPAATLLIWGFFVAFVFLIYGFLKRHTSTLTALVSVFLFLSVPIVGQSAVCLKNDMPVSLFIFSHYCALMESFDRRESSLQDSKRWMLFAGILSGGAMGHKLLAVPVSFFSCLAVLTHDLISRSKNKENVGSTSLTPFWLLGAILTISPWFLRNFFLTGNPVYPFLGKVFDSKLSHPVYEIFARAFPNFPLDFLHLKNFIHQLFNGYGNDYNFPTWGPSMLFGLLSIPIFLKPFRLSYRLCLGAALFSIIPLLSPFEVRYVMGLFVFIILLSFSLIWDRVLKRQQVHLMDYNKGDDSQQSCTQAKRVMSIEFIKKISQKRTVYKFIVIGVIALCARETIYNVYGILYRNFYFMLSGYSLGNFRSPERLQSDFRWVSHLINTKTDLKDGVLFAGTNYTYGIKRKTYPSLSWGQEMICDLAKVSSDADNLKQHLLKLGVRHILVKSSFDADIETQRKRYGLEVGDKDLKKISDLFRKHMILRFVTADNAVLWYSINDGTLYQPFPLNRKDVLDFPIDYIESARFLLSVGQIKVSQKMLETAVNIPMFIENRKNVYELLLNIYFKTGKTDKLHELINSYIKINNGDPISYDNTLFQDN